MAQEHCLDPGHSARTLHKTHLVGDNIVLVVTREVQVPCRLRAVGPGQHHALERALEQFRLVSKPLSDAGSEGGPERAAGAGLSVPRRRAFERGEMSASHETKHALESSLKVRSRAPAVLLALADPRSASQATLVQLSRIVAFQARLQQQGAAQYAPPAPRHLTEQLRGEAANFEAICDALEKRVVRCSLAKRSQCDC